MSVIAVTLVDNALVSALLALLQALRAGTQAQFTLEMKYE